MRLTICPVFCCNSIGSICVNSSCNKVEACTDPLALNYDESADQDNGNCVYYSTISFTASSERVESYFGHGIERVRPVVYFDQPILNHSDALEVSLPSTSPTTFQETSSCRGEHTLTIEYSSHPVNFYWKLFDGRTDMEIDSSLEYQETNPTDLSREGCDQIELEFGNFDEYHLPDFETNRAGFQAFPGQKYYFPFSVRNIGYASYDGLINLSVEILKDGELFDEFDTLIAVPNIQEWVEIKKEYLGTIEAGTYKITSRINPLQEIKELNYENNSAVKIYVSH